MHIRHLLAVAAGKRLRARTFVVAQSACDACSPDPEPTTDAVLAAVRRYGERCAASGSPASGYAEVRDAIFALRHGRPIPTPRPRADEVFKRER